MKNTALKVSYHKIGYCSEKQKILHYFLLLPNGRIDYFFKSLEVAKAITLPVLPTAV
jgi:hypothetical protein